MGINSGLDLDLHVFKSRTKVAIIVAPLLQRFNESIPQITCTALRTSANLQLGSLARVTHSKIYQAIGGARGVTNQAMLVIERALGCGHQHHHVQAAGCGCHLCQIW